MRKAVFLDRDGVINETIFRMGKPRAPYSLEELRLFSGVSEAVKALKAEGFLTIIVTNQPDVARGWVSREIVDAVNDRIQAELKADDIKACFHTEKDSCECRKPKPGMLLEAQKQWDIDLKNSYMVGDRYSDIEAGLRAGCTTILIGEGDSDHSGITPHYRALSLSEGVRWILSHT